MAWHWKQGSVGTMTLGGVAATARASGESRLLRNMCSVWHWTSLCTHLSPAGWQCTQPCVQGSIAAGTGRTHSVQENAGVPAPPLLPHPSPPVLTVHHHLSIPLSLSSKEHGLWLLFSCVEMPLVPLLAGDKSNGGGGGPVACRVHKPPSLCCVACALVRHGG